MTKSEIIIKEMYSVFNKHFLVSQNDVKELTEELDNRENLKIALSKLYDEIKLKKIKHLDINIEMKKDESIDELIEEFPIGLVDLSPSDFEGSEPLIIDEMVTTGLGYILESAKKRTIKSLTFYI